ncbi:MAG: hypothetical protein IAF38_05975, partial [Bacteroidia bacterium]|nr:hypothetical protein [Bacteroidia bacterium]
MSKESHLFELVQSLSKSEKRYVRLYAGLHEIGEKNNYLKLFDFIEKAKEPDDEKIQKAFKKEVFVKQLHVTKNYLHKMILKALRNFNSETGFETEMRNHFQDAEIL